VIAKQMALSYKIDLIHRINMSTYIHKNDQQLGPFGDAEILEKLKSREFLYEDNCWREGWEEWKPLKVLFKPTVTPPPLQKSPIEPPHFNPPKHPENNTYDIITFAKPKPGEVNFLKEEINLGTWNFVLLTTLSGGIYGYIWLILNTPIIEKETESKIANSIYLKSIIIFAGLYNIATITITTQNIALLQSGNHHIISLPYFLGFIAPALLIIWSYKARSAISNYSLKKLGVNININPIWTFIFNIYYINYCINSLPRIKEKQDEVFAKFHERNIN